ncbi:hypothetical protein J5N97_005303 [Dioscorea zingiberensis]|uniref:HMA domain-containing protein n=1 Tax=Dioscorea zingiberensis TaxID=325984 RepID=A0A9D5D9L4_9LILI|nr:hypothetical protein J5N97_005303 [Dioscorea zingiberensis]
MKQKIVIKVNMECEKCRSKAMKLVASITGVESVALEGKDRDQLVVIGDGVDSINLTNILRKKVGHADLVTVNEVKKNVEKKEKEGEKKASVQPTVANPVTLYTGYPPTTLIVYEKPNDLNYTDSCSIL